jgi:hypothetical protein
MIDCEHDGGWEEPNYWNDGMGRCYKCGIQVSQSGNYWDENGKIHKFPKKLDWMVLYDYKFEG